MRAVVQEQREPRRGAAAVLEQGVTERAVSVDGEHGQAVGVGRVGGDRMRRVAVVRDPDDRRAVGIGLRRLVEGRPDDQELAVRRELDRRGHAVGLAFDVHRVALRPGSEPAFLVDREQPKVVGAERVEHVERAAVGVVREGLRASAWSGHDVARPLDVHQRQASLVVDREARDRVVARVGGEEEPVVPAEDDAARALEGVRRALAVDDRVVAARPGAAGEAAFGLGERPVGGAEVVDDAVLLLVRLRVEVADGAAVH